MFFKGLFPGHSCQARRNVFVALVALAMLGGIWTASICLFFLGWWLCVSLVALVSPRFQAVPGFDRQVFFCRQVSGFDWGSTPTVIFSVCYPCSRRLSVDGWLAALFDIQGVPCSLPKGRRLFHCTQFPGADRVTPTTPSEHRGSRTKGK